MEEKGKIPLFTVEHIPVEQAMMMGRAPRMDPNLYAALEKELKELGDKAAKMDLPVAATRQTMKTRLLRIAQEKEIELTVRKTRNGLVFWKATTEELSVKEEIVKRLQGGKRGRPAGRKRG